MSRTGVITGGRRTSEALAMVDELVEWETDRAVRRQLLDVKALLIAPIGLAEAWAEAEAACPPHWVLDGLSREYADGRPVAWVARAVMLDAGLTPEERAARRAMRPRGGLRRTARGRTEVEALAALAVVLYD